MTYQVEKKLQLPLYQIYICTATLSKVKNELNLSSNLSITTDIWTSSSMKAFLAVTAHYINGSQLNSYLLETKQLVDRHSAGNVASALREGFESWDIFEKVHCIVTDNASNMRNAITVHLNKTHQPCIAHTLNLCTMNTLKHADLQQLLEKCKNIVGHFKRSTVASGELAKMQDQMKLPLLKVKQDVSTRWNSCLTMMQRLEELKVPLSAAMSNLPGSPSLLSSEDWALIKDCICILKPIEAMTSELSGEKYITLSIIIPLIRGVQHAVENAQPITSTGKVLQTNFHDILLRRLGYVESSKICAKATLLDPRLKILAFDKVINGNQALKWITQEVEDLIVTITQHLETPNSEIPCTQGRADSSENQASLLWEHFDIKAKQEFSASTPTHSAEAQIKQYLDLPLVDRKLNPLDFWESKKEMFPQLYKLANKYLCVPATSVPSERVFSKADELTKDRRSRLSSNMINEIMFLNSNM
ncbi:E3 SUMO-protein ligase ZBED1-like [Onthophagus taurus]|uniref:E3 SUMO-protein ligase ZBED1-like n=1 Tax=Onthophagus taurus TaxID=166361 RepID=UPI0039BE16F8